MSRWMRPAVLGFMVAGVAAAAASPEGPPAGGAAGPVAGAILDAALADSRGRPARLARFRGKPTVLFYEDKDSTPLNQPLKDELFRRGRALGLLQAAHVVAVANLTAFNWFPARGFALSAVRAEEKKWGVPILVDLTGTLGAPPWSLPTTSSSVVLLDAAGRRVWHASGRLDEQARQAFFHALSGLLGLPPPSSPAPADGADAGSGR